MRWTRPWAAAAVLASIAAAAFVSSCNQGSTSSTTNMATAAEDPIAHGKRLAWSSGCNDCHTPGSLYGTPDTTRLLSGSELGWVGPWGVSYPANLTPDSASGIGTWTEDQIVAAITTGHKADGSAILPPMPWPSFAAGFNNEDVHAIAKYLKSIPPVSHKVPAMIPPGKPVTGAVLSFPPPPAWDAQNLPPPPAAAAASPQGGRPEARAGKGGAPAPGAH